MVVVRALIEGSGGHVIAFRQQLMSVASHPAKLLFIQYPSQVQLFGLRSQARIPTLFPAKLTLTDEQPPFEGVIKDISLTGVMFDIKTTQLRFGLSAAEINATTVVIVLNDQQRHPLGIIVDGVSEVYSLTNEQIKPSPHVSVDVDHRYVQGIVSVPNGHMVLINMQALFDTAELAQPSQTEESWA